MKKITFLLVAFAMTAISTTQVLAQRIDVDAINSQLAKLDKSIEDPKKAEKAATWLKHAEAYFDAGKEPVKSLYIGSSMAAVNTTYGKARSSDKVTIGNKEMTKHTFTYAIVYETGGNVVTWEQTRDVTKGAFDKALSSYAKAMEVDPSVKAKAEAGIEKIANHYRDAGNNAISLEKYVAAGDNYVLSNKALTYVDKSKVDAKMIYMAGYLYTIDGTRDEKNKKSYAKGEEQLRAAIAAGYDEVELADESVAEGSKGSAYYYIFHCVMSGPGELTTERIVALKDMTVEAVTKYPKNDNLMDCLMQLYTTRNDIGTPEEAIAMVEKGIERNPDNISLWYSRGRMYSMVKNNDECIKSFENVIRLDPEGYNGHFYVGVFHTSNADEFNEEMREKEYKKQVDYDADFEVLCTMYKKALPYFEKAYEIQPENKTVLEYLKSIYYRVRNEEGMMDKYNFYNDLYNK